MTHDWSNSIWLARRQMRDLWLAYPYTAAYFAFMGAILAFGESNTLELAHILLMLILIQPVLSNRYMAWRRDNDVLRHQQFIVRLPIPFRTIISARMIAMLAAGLINIPLYFIWFWFMDSGWPSVGTYLAWIVFWVGIALVGTAFSLVMEFAVSIRKWAVTNIIIVGLLFVIVIPLLVFTDVRLIGSSISAAQDHPWMFAFIGLIIGTAALVAGPRLAEGALREREFAQ